MSRTSLETRVRETLTQLVRIPSVSRQEDQIRDYVRSRLVALQLHPTQDDAGNLIALLPGSGDREGEAPLLLNAHMDRVPPGTGCEPVIRTGRMYSDGQTNLGADDAAGITIVLLVLEELLAHHRPHRPILALFTVAEEIGLIGAGKFDPIPWNVEEGMIFDNAGDAGEVVTRGAAYIAFDVALRGRGGHPGKDLAQTANAIDIFRRVRVDTGELDGGLTRVSMGTITGGTARNAIAEAVSVQGEIRTLLDQQGQDRICLDIELSFTEAARLAGAEATCSFTTLASAYSVPEAEPLLQAFCNAWSAHSPFRTMSTFVASDANALRSRMRVFTVSTGVTDEHMVDESVALEPLADLVTSGLEVVLNYR